MDEVAARLAAHVANARYEDLPQVAIDAAKRAIVDTVGCSLAGSHVKSVQALVDLSSQWGGALEARILGFSKRVPAPLAAWCNGMMARVLEIDDCTDFRPMHPSASAVPAALAICEARGGISGRELVAAVSVAQDIKIRVGMAVRVDAMDSGRYNLFKIFAPTAAVASALKLDTSKVHHALGIAYSYACGEGQSAPEGASSLPLQQGTVAQNGLVAALLAERGNSGSRDFLFGRAGYFNAFEPNPVTEHILHRLGEYYYGADISVKPFAACRCCHEGIELAARVHRTLGGTERITGAKLTVGPNIKAFVGGYIESATDPYSPTAAQFSLPFTVATALTRGDFFLRELQSDVIGDEAIRELARRVTIEADPAYATDFVLGRAKLEVQLDDGSTIVEHVDLPLGTPTRPVSFEGAMEKARKCAAFSLNAPSGDALERFFANVAAIEDLDDTSDLLNGF